MIKVIGKKTTRAFRVLWTLKEVGLEYEHLLLNPGSDEVKAYNPTGKVPVIDDDGHVIADSCAIMQYLADKTGKLTYPAGSLERAKQDSLLFFILDELESLLWTAAKHTFILPEDKRVPGLKDTLRWEFARAEGILVGRMDPDGPYIMGGKMTVPDILLTHIGRWAEAAKFEIGQPKLQEYLKRMRANENYRALMEQD